MPLPKMDQREAFFRSVRANMPFLWNQAKYHIKFRNLKNGIFDNGRDSEIFAHLDPRVPQAWRVAPPKNAVRVNLGLWNNAMRMYGLPSETADPANVQPDRDNRRSQFSERPPRLASMQRDQGRVMVHEVARNLSNIGFKYVKTLGWGGEGIACLFQYTNRSRRRQYRVAKMNLRDGTSWRNENLFTRKFRGHTHIIQRQLAPDLNPRDIPQQDIERSLDDERVMLFEFAKYGNLANLLNRACELRADNPDLYTPLPNRVLVDIFHCLVSACIDLERPRNLGMEGQAQLPVVHFDLEPTNALFIDRDQNEHSIMPTLKVADFGLAREIPTVIAEDIAHGYLWDLRWRAKPRFFLPEQFSQDWDYVNHHPLQENFDIYGPVAGHFGPPSNIYCVGLTMWSCIAGVMPPYPTRPRLTPFPLPDNQPWWTFGDVEILDDTKYGGVDLELRQLVFRCLVEEPARRIDSADLLQRLEVKRAELKNLDGSRDGDLRDWVDGMFKDPPLPRAIGLNWFNPSNPSNDQFDPMEFR